MIVDVHSHLWREMIGGSRYFSQEAMDGWASNFAVGSGSQGDSASAANADAEMLIEALDKAEEVIKRAYHICAFAIDLRPLFAMEISVADLNDWVISEARRDVLGRIHPFACINPVLPGAVEEVHRSVAAGAEGFKIYPPTGFLPDDAAARPFYEAVLQAQDSVGRHLPVLCHTGASYSGSSYARPIHLQDVAFRYADLRLIAAHVGSPWTDEALWVAGIQRNVYVDIAAFGDLAGWWPELHAEALGKAKRVGAIQRVLYGSDWPLTAYWLPPNDGGPKWRNLHQVADAMASLRMPASLLDMGYPELTDVDLQGVLGDNAAQLLGISDSRIW
ncbi:MAG: amidohydrolase family protein [Actinomycetes bacterium]